MASSLAAFGAAELGGVIGRGGEELREEVAYREHTPPKYFAQVSSPSLLYWINSTVPGADLVAAVAEAGDKITR